MRQYNDVDHSVHVKGIDLTAYAEVATSYKQGDRTLVVLPDSMEWDADADDGVGETLIRNHIPQASAGRFRPGTVEVEVHWLTDDGLRSDSAIKPLRVERTNLPMVVTSLADLA